MTAEDLQAEYEMSIRLDKIGDNLKKAGEGIDKLIAMLNASISENVEPQNDNVLRLQSK